MISLRQLEDNLVDLNKLEDIAPSEVVTRFWDIKDQMGSLPMGVSWIEKKWYIISPSSDYYILWETGDK